jgi:hypothetical protein
MAHIFLILTTRLAARTETLKTFTLTSHTRKNPVSFVNIFQDGPYDQQNERKGDAEA